MAADPPVAPLQAGDPAPPFAVPDQHSRTVTLAAAPALLCFFPYAFTGVCTGELAELNTLLPDFERAGVRPLACSTDSMYAARVFADTQGFDFTLLSDHWPHGEVAQAYGVFDQERGCALRGSFLIDAEATVRWCVVNPIEVARDMRVALEQARRLDLGGVSSDR